MIILNDICSHVLSCFFLALLPPVKPLRPRTPPPPPPSQPLDPKVKPQQSPDLSQKISERQGKSQEVGISKPVSLFFKRPEFNRKPEAAASSPPTGAGSPVTAPSRKTGTETSDTLRIHAKAAAMYALNGSTTP